MKSRKNTSRTAGVPTIVEIPVDDIETSPCDERRSEPVRRGGMEHSIEIAGQTSLALVAHERVNDRWQLLDGRRVLDALKEHGIPTIVAEVADPDPSRAQLQVVHRHNVMAHSPSAKVRLLAQWKLAYETTVPHTVKHGGNRRRQVGTDTQLSFRRMAAKEWNTTPSTIDRYLSLATAPREVLRDLDRGVLTLTEAGALARKTTQEREAVLANKDQRKADARRAETEALACGKQKERERFWELVEALPERVRALYPDANPAVVARMIGREWSAALRAALVAEFAASENAA